MATNALVKSTDQEHQNALVEIEKTRVLQEVQAMVIVAQNRPRDEFLARKKIMDSAKRMTLAKSALYAYPRSEQIVKGPSIKTAETIARYWGNIQAGVRELSRDTRNHTSEVMSYAWDLESNTREEKIFKVQHVRETKQGNKILTNSRDIYELCANLGARRKRACILSVVPSDIVEDFITECEKTMAGDNSKPLKERVNDMICAFEEFGVTKEMIEHKIGYRADSFIEKNIIDLRAIYKSLKDKVATIEDFFGEPKKEQIKVEDVLNESDEKQLLQ